MADQSRHHAEREARVVQNLAAIESHLRECVDIAERGEKAFFGSDFVNRYAAYATLIQIGNAVKDLPEAFRAEHASVVWRALVRIRDKVGHIYGESIDWDIIWKTIINNAPNDLEALTRIRDTL